MKKIKNTLSIIIFIILIGCVSIQGIQMYNLFKKTSSTSFDIKKESLEDILDNASTFKIQKRILSLKKHYFIIVDDVVVGEVKGKVFPIFGDTLKMTDSRGNLVKSESQIKRLGPTTDKLFNLSINRLAKIQDSKGNITGYIGENKLKDFLNLNHIQYFYDADAKKIGSAKPNFFILSKDYKVKDNKNNIDYIIDGNIFSLSSKSTITKKDNSDIDEEDVIFYTIIENSIFDSKTFKSSSNNKSTSSKKK